MAQPQLSNANRRADRRRSAKRSTKAACRRGTLGLGPSLTVAVLDVSQTGCRLLVTVPLEKGQGVEVTLEAMGGYRPVRGLASVVWCVPAADGNHCVGLQFEKALSYLDLNTIASL